MKKSGKMPDFLKSVAKLSENHECNITHGRKAIKKSRMTLYIRHKKDYVLF